MRAEPNLQIDIDTTDAREPFLASLPPGATLLEHAFLLLSLGSGEEGAGELLRNLGVRVAACVVDTNKFLDDLGYSTRHGWYTALQLTARIGIARFYASTTVRDEVREKLLEEEGEYADRARRQGIDRREALRRWEHDYAPWISFLDPCELPPSPRVEALRLVDPDDVGTAQLIEFLRPEATFSEDKALRPFGVVRGEWVAYTLAYHAESVYGSVKVGLAVGGGLVLSIGYGALEGLLSLLSMLNPAVGLILAGGAIAAVLYPPARSYLFGQARGVTAARLWQAGELLGTLAGQLQELKTRADESRGQLPATGMATGLDTPPRRAMDYLGIVLSTAPAPLSVYEIMDRMVDAGYGPRGERPDRYVSRLLHRHPLLFEMVWGRRWRLRAHPAPPEAGWV